VSRMVKIVGMIDPHVHLRDLDWSHKATFASETAAALAGGYWAVLDMPNTQPSTTNRTNLDAKLAKIGAGAVCDWGVYFGAAQSGNWDEYAGVVNDICGLKIYNNQTTGDLLIEAQSLREEHYKHWPAERVIAVHAEEETVLDILALVRQYRKQTHFCHISSAQEIAYLAEAKAEGLPISIGVTPHHLYLSVDDLPRLGSLGLMKPELKTRADCEALWSALASGLVDVVESDHAPHTMAEKLSEKPPFGVPGLETTLPLMGLAVKEGRILQERMIDLLTRAGEIFGLITPPETYTLVELDAPYTLERSIFRSACGWSPFEGMTVDGRVREVWIRGQKVFDGETICVAPGFGQNVMH
jgi:dihydroorotase